MSQSVNKKYPMLNLYTLPEVAREGAKPFHYDSEKDLNWPMPCRFGIYGASGSRKSLFLCNLLRHLHCITNLYLVAPRLDEKLYKWLMRCHKQLGIKHVFAMNSLEEFDSLWEEIEKKARPDVMSLVVFDDLLGESDRVPESVVQLFARGRKIGLSACFISSSKSELDSRVRGNIDVEVLKRFNSDDSVMRILRGAGVGKEALSVYKRIVANPDDAFVIDHSCLERNRPDLKFRHNWAPVQLGLSYAEPPEPVVEPPPFVGGSVVRREQPTKHKKK